MRTCPRELLSNPGQRYEITKLVGDMGRSLEIRIVTAAAEKRIHTLREEPQLAIFAESGYDAIRRLNQKKALPAWLSGTTSPKPIVSIEMAQK